jgi:photosystem II stability/assembly factor-like uncharacterized protein
MARKYFHLFTLLFFPACLFGQTILTLTQKDNISFRGLSVVNDSVVWASGSGGSVAKSLDAGKTWHWQKVPGYENRDFRDIEAFGKDTAVIMAVAEPAVILKTTDGGNTWKKVFEDTTKGMFLDAMYFDGFLGVVVGDPINNHLFIAITNNQGENWENISYSVKDTFNRGEAFFAASGTNIKFIIFPDNSLDLLYVSGGMKSNLYFNDEKTFPLPIIQGKESTGANSIDIFENKGVIVGGDFANDKDTTQNCVLFDFKKNSDFEINFTHPQTPPHGYRSCVIYVRKNVLATCGTSGVDISKDGGMNWQSISNQSFHVVQKAKQGNAVFLAGANGKIARLVW